jgi:DNA-binding NarL/FixJ family response regulator
MGWPDFPEHGRWAVSSSADDEQGRSPARDRLDPGQEQPVRLLIVEDDFLIAMEAEAALTEAGYTILEVATTAEEAFALAKLHKPALAVMDIRLAGQRDGIDAAGDLYRELGLHCVFATAHDDQQTRRRAEPYGPLGWLTKPYTTASLVSLVRAALSKPS